MANISEMKEHELENVIKKSPQQNEAVDRYNIESTTVEEPEDEYEHETNLNDSDEEEENGDFNVKEHSNAFSVSDPGSVAKRRKKHDPNRRRKIRNMFTEDKLNEETLLAIQNEELRRKRIAEQAELNRAQQLQQETIQQSTSVARPESIPENTSYLASLLTSKKQDDVICISSDSDSEDRKVVDLSSDSSDDVICTGEIVDKPELEDVNNSGMHIDDIKNQRDLQGRVLVNVNRPTNEPEIFLSPQLSKAVLPHQIGGIRFMFDNIVESLSHYETSSGFGCILAHSMGLGKTLQVISFIDVFLRFTKAKTVLCVVPVNTLLNWIAEFHMWLPLKSKCVNENPAEVWPRSFSVHILHDIHKNIESRYNVIQQWSDEGGVLLLGYEMYRLLTSRKPKKKRKRKNTMKVNSVIDLEEDDRLAKLATAMQESLMKPGPDLIICDEGHRIKNSHASISQMLKSVQTKRRIVLTGYPLQNNLMEYWCMVDFVRPNFLGTKPEFSNMFERPILNGQCADSTESDVRLMRFRSHVLHSLLKGFVQRRSHSVLQNALPLKEEHVLMIRLSQWQKKLYNTFLTAKMEGGSGSWCSSINPIRAFSISCKIWNHPDILYKVVCEKTDYLMENTDLDPDFDLPEMPEDNFMKSNKSHPKNISLSSASNSPSSSIQSVGSFLDDKEKGVNYDWAKDLFAGYSTGILELSGKMIVLMQLVYASVESGDRMLVFSQSLSTLTLIEEFLSKQYVPKLNSDGTRKKWCKNESYYRLDGNTNSTEREKLINAFNSETNENVWLFLLSTRAGCLGINLIGANRVIIFDASWNPCHDAQAVCRVYRYGQTKKCHIYRFICDQSMEKKIYERQVSKQGMSDRVVDKLNPTQIFMKQDVVKLLEYSDVEMPPVNFDNVEDEYLDQLLINVCKRSGHWLTKRPFTHESLLLDCKDQRLTKAEKRAAEKSYERDKLASSAYNYSRPSYANFYGQSSSMARTQLPKPRAPSFQQFSSQLRRPIANVRPMQSTPLPMQLQSNMANNNMMPRPTYSKSGIMVHRVLATTDIRLPPTSTTTDTVNGGQPTKISMGEPICIIRGRKGTYLRTKEGRTFAIRSNDNSSLTTTSDPKLMKNHIPQKQSAEEFLALSKSNYNQSSQSIRNPIPTPNPMSTFMQPTLYGDQHNFSNIHRSQSDSFLLNHNPQFPSPGVNTPFLNNFQNLSQPNSGFPDVYNDRFTSNSSMINLNNMSNQSNNDKIVFSPPISEDNAITGISNLMSENYDQFSNNNSLTSINSDDILSSQNNSNNSHFSNGLEMNFMQVGRTSGIDSSNVDSELASLLNDK